MLTTLIVKPTKHCNATCDYCSAPPTVNGAPSWTPEMFMSYFDKVRGELAPRSIVLWHGGEPMLMSPEFYRRCWDYARSVHPGIRFAMQSNIILYSTKRWRDTFIEVFDRQVSTSFDPDEKHREYKGSTDLYTKLFMQRLEWMIEDGFRPKILGTYTDETVDFAHRMYDMALGWGERAPALRFNYRFPAGRQSGAGELISPESYGKMLVSIYDRWIADVPSFSVTPMDQMFDKVVGRGTSMCPWTKGCGGQFLAIEPNGDVYNCATFADLGDTEYRFGNIDIDDLPTLMRSPAALAIKRRRYDVPKDCLTCRHFEECEGGCARDSVLYGNGMGGKFHYCQSWKMVFDRIKQSIRTGEADGILRSRGFDPETARSVVAASSFERVMEDA